MDAKAIIKTFLSPNQPKLDIQKLGFDPYKEMTRLRIAISTEMPFFSNFVMSYPTVIMSPSHPLITTAATDGNHFFFNALFMHLLNTHSDKKGNNNEQKFVFCHEIMHVVFDSMGRRGSRDPALWNVATDYVINQTLVEFGLEMPRLDVMKKAMEETKEYIDPELLEQIDAMNETFHKSDQDYVGLLDHRFEGMTAEQVYEILKEEDEQNGGNGQGTGNGNSGDGSGQGGSGQGGSGLHRDKQTMDTHILDELDEEEKKEIARQARSTTLQAANEAKEQMQSKGRGSLPLGLQRMIDDWVKPKVPWSQHIVAELDSLRVSDYSPLRVDPRFFSGGVTLEGMEYETSCRIGIIVDTSGSIGEDDLRKVLGELYGIITQFDAFEIDIISCDTQVYGHMKYDTENGEDILQYPFIGGGGTLFEPAMQWMKEQQTEESEQYDAVIFFTDGYGEGWCEDHQSWVKKMIWVIVESWGGQSPDPTWGTTIKYDEYE